MTDEKNSDKRRGSRTPIVRATPKSAAGLTDVRRERLEADLENGIIKEGGHYGGSHIRRGTVEPRSGVPTSDSLNRGEWVPTYGGGASSGGTRIFNPSGGGTVPLAAVAHSESYIQKQATEAAQSLRKQANIVSSGGTTGGIAPGAVDRLAPEVYSPLFTMANLNLPRDRITINAWIRNFFDLHPIVRNALTLHATYPISKLNIKCQDKKILSFFEDMIEDMDLLGALGMIALEFWKMGECFPYAELNENTGTWTKIIINNPDYVHVKKQVLAGEPMISMKPDAVLQRLAMSNNPADIQLRKQIPDKILHYVRTGKDVPLDNFNVSHLKMLSAPYDVRGTSVVVSVFKDLMLYDKIREAKFAQADGMVNPLTVVKVGGTADGDYRATQEDLEYFRQIFEEAQYDKDFKLITHAGVDVSRVGFSGQTLDIASDMELIVKNIYTGLMVPPAVVDSDGSSYSQASIGLEVLRQRYFNFRNLMAKWLQNKIFAPISEIHDFYEYKDGRKRLIVPEVEWNQMNLYDLQDYIGNVTGLLAQKQVSLQTVYKSLGLNYDDEQIKIRQEMIDETIRLQEQAALASMSLTELRSLDPEKEIMAPIDEKERVPKGGGAAGAPGSEMPGGDMGLGGGGAGGGLPGGGGEMPGGLPELAPPPEGELGGGPGGPGAPPIPGGTPEVGPGAGTPGPGGV